MKEPVHNISRRDVMLQFIIGSIFGGTVGMTAICLCTAAKWGDHDSESN